MEIRDLIKKDTDILDREQRELDNIIKKYLKLNKITNG